MSDDNGFGIFPQVENLGHRDWGSELLLAVVPGSFTLKRLEMRAGTKGGLQFHRKKHEVATIVTGRLLIRYDRGDGVLHEQIVGPGDVVHFAPGIVHQEEALSDCVLIEASTPHFNDRVRVEGHYGLEVTDGLPTTRENEIIER